MNSDLSKELDKFLALFISNNQRFIQDCAITRKDLFESVQKRKVDLEEIIKKLQDITAKSLGKMRKFEDLVEKIYKEIPDASFVGNFLSPSPKTIGVLSSKDILKNYDDIALSCCIDPESGENVVYLYLVKKICNYTVHSEVFEIGYINQLDDPKLLISDSYKKIIPAATIEKTDIIIKDFYDFVDKFFKWCKNYHYFSIIYNSYTLNHVNVLKKKSIVI